MIDLKLIRTFSIVARLKSFVKAAEFLNMTQPGVSQHVARLEDQLGARLIARSRKSADLTPAGEVLLRHAKRVFAMFDRIEAECREAAHGRMRISVGLSSSAIYSQVPKHIARFADTVPEAEVVLRVVAGDELMRHLDWGELDVIVTTLPVTGNVYHCVQIGTQRMGVALHADHPLATREMLSLADISEEPFIVVPRDQHPANHDMLKRRFAEMKATLNIASYETAFPTLLARVSIGEGVGLVALGYGGGDDSSFKVLPLDDPFLADTPVYAIALNDSLPTAGRRLMQQLAAERA